MDGNRIDLEETGWSGAWSGFGWLRTRTGGGLLWTQWWTFRFWRHGVRYKSTRRHNLEDQDRHCNLCEDVTSTALYPAGWRGDRNVGGESAVSRHRLDVHAQARQIYKTTVKTVTSRPGRQTVKLNSVSMTLNSSVDIRRQARPVILVSSPQGVQTHSHFALI
jgi:hypothetical protein